MHDGKDVVSSHAGNLYRRTKNQKPLMIALQLTFFKMALPDIKLSVYSLPHKYREEDLFLGLMKNHAAKHMIFAYNKGILRYRVPFSLSLVCLFSPRL